MKTHRLGPIASQIKGFAHGQPVFAVMSGRAGGATVLFTTIAKDPCDRLARKYREGTAPAFFPQACVRPAFVSGEDEITLIERPRPAKSAPLVDVRTYHVECAGVRSPDLTLPQAVDRAISTRNEWRETGINSGRGRQATVFYRDGSKVGSALPCRYGDHLPSGSLAYADGRDVVIVREAFPTGSTSFLHPHYKVDFVEGDKNVAVPWKRISEVRHVD